MTSVEAGQEPRAVCTGRLAARRARAEHLVRHAARISNARLLVFALGVAALIAVFVLRSLPHATLLPPAAGFLALVVWHDRVLRARARADRAVAFHERALARIEDRWAGGGETGERHRDEAHLYAEDLDLFGRGSLFELLCAARTRAGEDTLAAWLLAPADPGEVRARQAAVAELAPHLDLREDLAVLGDDVRAGVHPEPLCRWGEAPGLAHAPGLRVAAALLALLALGALAAWIVGAGPLPFVAALLAEAGFAVALRGRVRRVVRALDIPVHDLALLAELLLRLERERFVAPRLAALRDALGSGGAPASREIARLRWLAELLDARRNQLFAPIGAMLLWTSQIALAVEAWRARNGPKLARWIAAVGEFEALASLAGFAFENPAHPFPEILPDGPPRIEAEALGHPLLPRGRCIANDLVLDPEHALLVVSGSNMSGKSTFLRTIGVNTVLALAGATVRARRLRLTPVAVGASIRIQDSLQEGHSRFYAEITRIRSIVERTGGPLPVLYLLDEVLQGTNSHDRRIGAEAILRGLLARGALGLVTTHDLALAAVAEALAPRAANVHFEDHLEDGAMHFDYRLRPGVVTKSNALALMRAVGLEV